MFVVCCKIKGNLGEGGDVFEEAALKRVENREGQPISLSHSLASCLAFSMARCAIANVFSHLADD